MQRCTHWPAAPAGSAHRPVTASLPVSVQRRPLIHPRFRTLSPPIIVIGMHRSGTSPVAAVLQALGVYMGPPGRLQGERAELSPLDGRTFIPGYAEAEDFRQLNELLLTRAGAAWNQVEPFFERRHHPPFCRTGMAMLQRATFGRLRTGYLWPTSGIVTGMWGWKDPRNSLTLPYWLRVFPGARIIHVRRNEDDVVESLCRRARAWEAAPAPPLPWGPRVRGWFAHPVTTLRRAGRWFGFLPTAHPDPCLDRDACRRLYQQYVQECLRYREWGDCYFELSYEHLVEEPLTVTRRLAEFVGSSPAPSRVLDAAALVHRDRRHARVF